jgi:hypothetical protein
MAACLLVAGCGSSGTDSNAVSASSSAAATSTGTASWTGGDNALPLYGSHVRTVPGLKQPNAARPHRQEWYLEFPQSIERRDGVLKLDYAIQEGYKAMGWAYKYSADTKILRLGAPTKVKGLRLGGFACRRDGPATYAWSRFDNNYTLRLKAVVEPCEIRRAVLEGDWHFLD